MQRGLRKSVDYPHQANSILSSKMYEKKKPKNFILKNIKSIASGRLSKDFESPSKMNQLRGKSGPQLSSPKKPSAIASARAGDSHKTSLEIQSGMANLVIPPKGQVFRASVMQVPSGPAENGQLTLAYRESFGI